MASLHLIPVAALAALAVFLWKYFRHLLVKSPLDNVPGPASDSFVAGNLGQLLDTDGWPFLNNLGENYNGVAKLHVGMGHKALYIFDPVAMHHVIVKDQNVYSPAPFFTKTFELSLGRGLLASTGERHRVQRKMMNPVFSTAHMRNMIPIFNTVVHKLQDAIDHILEENQGKAEVDILSWMGRLALELIGQTGLGYSFDPLTEDTVDEFAVAAKSFQAAIAKVQVIRRILPYLPNYARGLQRKIMDLIPSEGAHQLGAIVDTMHRRSVEIYESKKKALAEGDGALAKQIGEGKDIMSILMRANMAASEEDKLPEDQLIGQMTTFIFAAMDTTSNALSLIFSFLADHPDVQDKLRAEILEATPDDGDFDYDTLVNLPYLDAVCRETLRLETPVPMIFREATEDIVLPLSEPIRGRDGTMMHEIAVPKDTSIIIGAHSSNRNKAVWGEDALEWKPERWLEPLPSTVTNAKIPGVYSHLMTFNGGGRACIGFKFSQLEMKVVLCQLLSKFTFSRSMKTIKWNISGIRYPTVGNSSKPTLPMIIRRYKA